MPFTYSKIVLFSVVFFVVLLLISLFMVKTILAKWFDPAHAQMEANRKLNELELRVDSLAIEVDRKDRFIANFQRVLSGDTSEFVDPVQIMTSDDPVPNRAVQASEGVTTDTAFRSNYERSDLSLISYSNIKFRELQETFFYTPITGFISDRYDAKKGHYGVDIVTKTNEPVKCIADGMVIISSWTQDSGYVIAVQHRGNLISLYKHNSQLLKKVGSFVSAGDIISIVGNSGEMTDGPHLHFELWYNGNSVNPEEFVTF